MIKVTPRPAPVFPAQLWLRLAIQIAFIDKSSACRALQGL
jgi:hypothetical protein